MAALCGFCDVGVLYWVSVNINIVCGFLRAEIDAYGRKVLRRRPPL